MQGVLPAADASEVTRFMQAWDLPLDSAHSLIRRARMGEREAFMALVRRHQDRVFLLAWLLLPEEATAVDAAAEGFARAEAALRRRAAPGPMFPLVARELVRVIRERRRRPLAGGPAVSARFAGTAPEVATSALAVLRSLETDEAAALALRYVLGASGADLMLTLGWRRREVARRMARAEARFRAAMQERAPGRRPSGEPADEHDARRALASLAAAAPPAPAHLAAHVERRIEAPARGPFRPPYALAIAVGVVAAMAMGFGIGVGLLAASEPVREWLRVGPSEAPAAPLPSPTPVSTPTPVPVSGFARPVTLAEARQLVSFPLMFPEGWPGPDAVYVWEPEPGNPVVILSYLDGGFDLYEGPLADTFDQTPVELARADVNGAPARWLQGGAIVLHYVDASGRAVVERKRIVERNTLVWERAGVTLRIETSRALPFAVAIARAVR